MVRVNQPFTMFTDFFGYLRNTNTRLLVVQKCTRNFWGMDFQIGVILFAINKLLLYDRTFYF